MKRIVIILFLLITTNALLSTVTAFAQLQPGSPAAVKPPDPPPLPEATPFAVAERGAHHRVWERMTYEQSPSGRLVPKPRRYAELATGLHYWEEGQWKESQELIEGYPGGAVARHGQHKVIFANNLNTAGAIDMEMPDGRRLQSHVLGLAYFDSASGKSVLIAEVKDCQGKILSPNQVLYEDAFTDVRADVRYTYTRAGFEQDVILRERPPLPEAYGLDSRATRLQVWTEFVNAPQPMVTARAVASGAGDVLADQKLDFGAMEIGAGRAFSLGNETESDPSGAVPALGGASIPASRSLSPATRRSSRSVPVGKQWVGLEGRQFLVEEVAVAAVAEQLDALPAAKSAAKVGAGSARDMVSAKRFLPGPKVAGPNSGQMQGSQADAAGAGLCAGLRDVEHDLDQLHVQGRHNLFHQRHRHFEGHEHSGRGRGDQVCTLHKLLQRQNLPEHRYPALPHGALPACGFHSQG